MLNSHHFEPAQLGKTLLRARGFDAEGYKSGGVTNPRMVTLPARTILIRTYQQTAGLLGDWWFTPHEMRLIVDYFGRAGPGFSTGRSEGKGILPATMAVREDWGRDKPRPLGMMGFMAVIRSDEPLYALIGEGDVAPDTTQSQLLKPARIMVDGRQRVARQIFLPDLKACERAVSVLRRDLPTDEHLIKVSRQYGALPQPFEL